MQYLPMKYISVCSMMIGDIYNIYKNLKHFFAKIHPGTPLNEDWLVGIYP